MRRGPTRELISLGLIGAGPSWERRYRAAVKRLSHRLCIRVVHDPVLGRAQLAAQESGAEVVAGLKQALCHPGLNGVLVLDAGWYGFAPLEFACEHQRPAFLAGNWSSPPKDWWQWHLAAQERGLMFVPELSWRFQPSTTRLRELIASRLGPVRQIHIEISVPSESGADVLTNALAGAVDWCGYLSRQSPDVFSSIHTANGSGSAFQLSFRPDLRGVQLEPAKVELVQNPGSCREDA
ncbi:MAG TPA: hypothetical protein VFG20_02465, partial [Planctomycetaceae bacterium]|nr:hypothetical protein [Planctomycetaceae bacterium]